MIEARPNDRRGLFGINIGRVLGGAVTGFLAGGPLGAVAGGALGARSRTSSPVVPGRITVPQIQPPVPSRINISGGNLPVSIGNFAGAPPGRVNTFGGGCGTGFFIDPRTGQCLPLEPSGQVPGFKGVVQRFLPGGESGFQEFGQAEMSSLGAGLSPGVRPSNVRVCPRGTVLGKDGLCHNKRDIRNTDRAWPRGRRPLLTGGELKAISTASRAAGKLQRKQAQLQELGLLKKPAPRKRKQLPPAHHHHPS